MKIKVTKEVKELQGSIIEKVATPFGNSAHINVGKKHTGKFLSIIEPENPEYAWVLSKEDLKKTIALCNKVLDTEDNKLTQVKRNRVNDLKDRRFEVGSLYTVIGLLEKVKGENPLLKLIKKTYNL